MEQKVHFRVLRKWGFFIIVFFGSVFLLFQGSSQNAFTSHSLGDPCPTHTPNTISTKLGGWAWNTYFQWMSQNGTYEFQYTENEQQKKKKCTYRVYREGTGRVPEGEEISIKGWSYLKDLEYYACWGETCGDNPIAPGRVKPYAKLKREKICEDGGSTCSGDKIIGEKIVVKGLIKLSSMVSGDEKDKWICLDPNALKSVGADADMNKKICQENSAGGGYTVDAYEVLYDEATNEFAGSAWNRALGWFTFSGRIYSEKESSICREYNDFVNDTERQNFYNSLPDKFRGDNPLSGDNTLSTVLNKWENDCKRDIENYSFNVQTGKAKWNTFYIGPGTRVRRGSAYSGVGFGGDSTLSEVDYLIYTKEPGDSRIHNWVSRIKTTPGSIDQTGKVPGQKSISRGQRTFLRAKPLPETQGKIKVSLPKKSPQRQMRAGQPQPPPSQQQTSAAIIRSRVGALNIKALTTLPDVQDAGRKNKYGFEVVKLESADLLQKLCGSNNIFCDLKGRVFFYDGDLVLNKVNLAPFVNFSNSSGKSGGGTIIVRGNLTISIPIYYDTTSTISLNKLASVAWVALKRDNDPNDNAIDERTGGNIIIDDCLSDPRPNFSSRANLVGVFFAEGKIVTGTGQYSTAGKRNSDLTLPNDIDDAYKTANQCQSIPSEGIPLIVNGIMVAKAFQLERLYGGVDIGSEEIIYDGRLMANIPPGLEDIVKSLPKAWR